MSAEEATHKVFSLFDRYGGEDYLGESVSQLEHAVQCAMAAEHDRATDDVVLGALLHDIGHLAGKNGDHMETNGIVLGVQGHDKVGEHFLSQLGVPAAITDFVRGHVQAKRYLTYKDPTYYEKLSAASKMTLEHQGGPMTSSEAAAFELSPRFEDILKMRTWDEQAKVKGMTLTPLIKYRNMFKSYMEAAL